MVLLVMCLYFKIIVKPKSKYEQPSMNATIRSLPNAVFNN